MIRHPAKCMDPRVVFLDGFRDDRLEPQAVLPVREKILTVIASQYHVIHTTRNV
jgi:hypothetical protein